MPAAAKIDVEHAALRIELRIVEQVAGPRHRCERNIDTIKNFRKFGALMPRDDRSDERAQTRARTHAVLIGPVRRMVEQIAAAKLFAKALPLPVAGQADENLLAVGGRERLVNRPGAFTRRHWRQRPSGDNFAGHMLHHQKRGRFEQSGFDHLPASGALALTQRRLDADHREHAAHDVDYRRSGTQRLARRSGHIGEPGHELHHFIERGAVLVRAAEETFQRAIDQPRILLRKIVVAAAKPLHGTGREIFENDVGLFRQPIDQCPSFVVLQIDREAALVAVECGEETGGEADQAAGRIAIGRFDFDHVGAEIGKD